MADRTIRYSGGVLLFRIGQIVRADQCQFAFFILECQQALGFPLQAVFNREMSTFWLSKRAMALKMQDMDGRQFLIT